MTEINARYSIDALRKCQSVHLQTIGQCYRPVQFHIFAQCVQMAEQCIHCTQLKNVSFDTNIFQRHMIAEEFFASDNLGCVCRCGDRVRNHCLNVVVAYPLGSLNIFDLNIVHNQISIDGDVTGNDLIGFREEIRDFVTE